MLDTVSAALKAISNGELVLVVDDEDRENEGDLIMAASKASAEKIGFMIRHTSGIICAPLMPAAADRLHLPLMVPTNTDRLRTAFTVSVDYKVGLTTGISAEERASTLRALANHNCAADDFLRPGHVFPLTARPGGVLVRSGHTEAAVDLMTLSGNEEVGVLAEVVNDDGSVMRLPGLIEFARKHGLKIISIDQLIEHRIATESIVRRVSETTIKTPIGPATAVAYRTVFDDTAHIAVIFGNVAGGADVPCRIHHEQPIVDLFRPAGPMQWLDIAMKAFASSGNGVLIYVRDTSGVSEEPNGTDDQAADAGSLSRRKRRWREVGLGAQILRDLKVSSIRLLATRHRDYVGLSGFGIRIASTQLVEA
jgi:3,4-dihydroxy 2-butanone 4-phosphate synthase/GTP cyclohydrolase II